MQLTACVTSEESFTLVTLGGYIDLSTRKQLRDLLNTASKGVCHLVIDMSKLEFMDSTGLNVLIDLYRKLEARGATLDLAAPRPIVAKVLEISGLDRVFRVHTGLAQAMGGATGQPAQPSS